MVCLKLYAIELQYVAFERKYLPNLVLFVKIGPTSISCSCKSQTRNCSKNVRSISYSKAMSAVKNIAFWFNFPGLSEYQSGAIRSECWSSWRTCSKLYIVLVCVVSWRLAVTRCQILVSKLLCTKELNGIQFSCAIVNTKTDPIVAKYNLYGFSIVSAAF